MKRILIIIVLTFFCISNLFKLALAAEEKKPAVPVRGPAKRVGTPNFVVIMGSISKIDTADPAKPKLEVKSEADNTTHTIEMTPWTNVSKITDLSELKNGDAVRIMARKADDKEIAINVLFGNIKNIPAAKPAFKGQGGPMQQPVSPTKQEQAKKY